MMVSSCSSAPLLPLLLRLRAGVALILLVLLLVAADVPGVWAQEVTVGPSPSDNVTNVGAALALVRAATGGASASGWTISLAAGVFLGTNNNSALDLTDFSGLTIRGSPSATTTVNLEYRARFAYVIRAAGLNYALTLRNLTIINGLASSTPNPAIDPLGGALYFLQTAGTVSLVGCKFTDCGADLSGGAIYASAPQTGGRISLRVSDGTFDLCDAPQGAAISGQGSADINATGVRFTRNAANGNTGGVLSMTDSITWMSNCFFGHNTAASNNNAALGGAIFAEQGSGEVFLSTFENNSAAIGGAVALRRASYEFADCSFVDNRATSDGGAISSDQSGGVLLVRTPVRRNIANSRGGGIHVNSAAARLLDSPVTQNSGGSGGALQFLSGAVGYLRGSDLTGNTANKGGALYLHQRAEVELIGLQISSNRATDDGGGVFCSDSEIKMDAGVVFSGNSADNDDDDLHCSTLIQGSVCRVEGDNDFTDKCEADEPDNTLDAGIVTLIVVIAIVFAVCMGVLILAIVYRDKFGFSPLASSAPSDLSHEVSDIAEESSSQEGSGEGMSSSSAASIAESADSGVALSASEEDSF